MFNKLNTQLETQLLESLKCVAEERGLFLSKILTLVNTDWPIHDFTVTIAPVQNIDGIITVKF